MWQRASTSSKNKGGHPPVVRLRRRGNRAIARVPTIRHLRELLRAYSRVAQCDAVWRSWVPDDARRARIFPFTHLLAGVARRFVHGDWLRSEGRRVSCRRESSRRSGRKRGDGEKREKRVARTPVKEGTSRAYGASREHTNEQRRSIRRGGKKMTC